MLGLEHPDAGRHFRIGTTASQAEPRICCMLTCLLMAVLAGDRAAAALQRRRGQVRHQDLQLGCLPSTLELARLQRGLKLQDLSLQPLHLGPAGKAVCYRRREQDWWLT